MRQKTRSKNSQHEIELESCDASNTVFLTSLVAFSRRGTAFFPSGPEFQFSVKKTCLYAQRYCHRPCLHCFENIWFEKQYGCFFSTSALRSNNVNKVHKINHWPNFHIIVTVFSTPLAVNKKRLPNTNLIIFQALRAVTWMLSQLQQLLYHFLGLFDCHTSYHTSRFVFSTLAELLHPERFCHFFWRLFCWCFLKGRAISGGGSIEKKIRHWHKTSPSDTEIGTSLHLLQSVNGIVKTI